MEKTFTFASPYIRTDRHLFGLPRCPLKRWHDLGWLGSFIERTITWVLQLRVIGCQLFHNLGNKNWSWRKSRSDTDIAGMWSLGLIAIAAQCFLFWRCHFFYHFFCFASFQISFSILCQIIGWCNPWTICLLKYLWPESECGGTHLILVLGKLKKEVHPGLHCKNSISKNIQ